MFKQPRCSAMGDAGARICFCVVLIRTPRVLESEMPFFRCASRIPSRLCFFFCTLRECGNSHFRRVISLLRSIGILYHRPRMGVAAKMRLSARLLTNLSGLKGQKVNQINILAKLIHRAGSNYFSDLICVGHCLHYYQIIGQYKLAAILIHPFF
jgi:hypothetical protein